MKYPQNKHFLNNSKYVLIFKLCTKTSIINGGIVIAGDLVQCIICGEKTELVKIFDRVSAGFCVNHYPEENEIKEERKVILVESCGF